jgi:hypothetical protein
MHSVVVHAHFYQPPREDPWLELVEREHSAAPFHDWNARIEQDCYRAVVAARVLGPDGRIRRIVNLLSRISFDVGATLLDWLAREAPGTYAAILAADRESVARLGHGNALAMPYHHVILPLASERDRVTEVRWGIRDFRRRFGRDPAGMWLPETAVDPATLDVLAREGIRFTVLAPHQLTAPVAAGRPVWVRTAADRRIAVFAYDGAAAHDVAFGPLIRDAEAWARRMLARPGGPGPSLASVATDGETFGHHHRFGEMALAGMLERVEAQGGRIENFASFLARHPPEAEAGLAAPSSWSCAHGVERWRADCGCRIEPGTSQAWRAPLREALDWLKGELDARFDRAGRVWFDDPWAARDAHDPDQPPADLSEAARLLEMQRNALRMFTSCGWFFDDIAGIESLLCLRYAARALELTGRDAGPLQEQLRRRLAAAVSNDPEAGTGADLLDREVLPGLPAAHRVAAGVAALAAAADGATPPAVGVWDVVEASDGLVTVRHRRTGETVHAAATVRLDGVARLRVGVRPSGGPESAVAFADLPEPVRATLRRLTQARLVASALNGPEREALAAGTRTFAEVLERAMLRHLGGSAETAEIEALRVALDLLALDSRPVPFDVQTRFHRLVSAATPAGRARLAPLAPLFGFSEDSAAD